MHERGLHADRTAELAAAEEIGVAGIALARLTGARIHLSQVTTAGSVEPEQRRPPVSTIAAFARHLVLTDREVDHSVTTRQHASRRCCGQSGIVMLSVSELTAPLTVSADMSSRPHWRRNAVHARRRVQWVSR